MENQLFEDVLAKNGWTDAHFKMSKKYTQQELNYITNNYKTMSNDEIGAELGLTRDAIRKKLKRLKLKKTPEGFVIHHYDGNPQNNSPNNLVMLPRLDHQKIHCQISKIIRSEL